MALITLYVDSQTGAFVAGPASTSAAALPKLYCPDTPTFKIYLLTPLPGTNLAVPYATFPTAGITFMLYLNDGTLNGTVYTQQITWTAGSDATGQFFTANLALNTSALITLVTAGTTNGGSCWMVMGYIQNGLPTTFERQSVTVLPGMPSTNVAAVPPGQTPLSVEVATSMFLTQQPVAGQPVQLKSPLGKIILLRAVDMADGSASFAADPLN